MREKQTRLRLLLVLAFATILTTCGNIPSGTSAAAKIFEADGNHYTACS
jgi:hypothetical protein